MLLGLGLTAYTIYSLKTQGLNPKVQVALGLQPTSSAPTSTHTENFDWNWCDTRVLGLTKADGFRLEQEGNRWVWIAGGVKDVDFLSVEKWLSRFCEVPAEVAKPSAGEDFSISYKVKFVDGSTEVLKRTASGVYQWRGREFKSPAFDMALAELENLPKADR